MKIVKLLTFVIFLTGTQLFAQFEVGLVMPFENNSRDPKLDWISESFVEVLSSTLASPRFMMLDRRDRAAAFDSLGIPNTGILSDATIYKVGRTVDATKLIKGHYDLADGVFKCSAQVLDMDGLTLSKEFAESGKLNDLMELQTGLSWQILHFLRPALPVTKSEFIADHRPTRVDAFENYLRGTMAKGRDDQLRFLRNAQRLDPQFTKPALELGLLYFRDHDYPTSVLWLSKLRRGDDDYLDANYFLGLAFLYQGQFEKSAAAFRVVAQQLPLNEVYNNLGIALLRDDKPGANAYFEKAIESNPNDPDYQFNLGYAFWKKNDCTQALPHLRKAAQGDSKPASRLIYKLCLDSTGQADESSRIERLLQQQAPDWVDIKDQSRLQNLARTKDNFDGASLRHLRMLMNVQTESKHAKLPLKQHAALHYSQAQQLMDTGFDREAADEFKEAIDYDPVNDQAYLQLGKIYSKAKRYDEATKALLQSIQSKESVEGHVLLARVLLSQAKMDDAIAQINAALKLDPSNAEANTMMQNVNSKLPIR